MKATSKHSSGTAGKDPVPAAHAAEQAERCRRLAQATFDRKTSEMLDRMAEDYDRQAKSGRH